MERNTGVIEVSFELIEDALKLASDIKITDIFNTDESKFKNTVYMKFKYDSTKLPITSEGTPLIIVPLKDIQDGD